MSTNRRTWQRKEQKAAAIFGSVRQPCSGSMGRDDQTSSDACHPRLFIESKLRASHAVLAVWDEAKKQAHKEGKDPVVILSQKGRHGQWLLIHEADMPAIVANWLASQDWETVLPVLARANEYRLETPDSPASDSR